MFIAVLLACCFLLDSAAAGVCPYKVCSCGEYQISCMNLDLTSLPPLTVATSNGSSLLLDGNHITTVSSGSLPAGLTSISFKNNPVTTIDDAAFAGSASTLQSLIFSKANFTRIPDAFLRLNALKYLTIYDSQIYDWNTDAMKHIGQTLETMDLENVSLTAWPQWMNYFHNLTELTLDNTTISFIQDDAFDSLVNSLTTLTISNAQLTSVPKTLSTLTVLQSLNLRNNRISDLTWLPGSSKLSSLFLSNNNISDARHLNNALLPYSNCLHSLEIKNNHMTSIPDLSHLKHLVRVDLSSNKISNSTVGSMPSYLYKLDLRHNLLPAIPSLWIHLQFVLSLYLSYNAVTEIRSTDFHPNTADIFLEYNLITELTNTSFPKYFAVVNLNLNNNPIRKISPDAFDGLVFLTSLKLQQTQLTRIPLALVSLISLYTLDMRNSTSLLCTCMEKALTSRILSTPQVFGQCGETNIREFFVTLSSSCPQ